MEKSPSEAILTISALAPLSNFLNNFDNFSDTLLLPTLLHVPTLDSQSCLARGRARTELFFCQASARRPREAVYRTLHVPRLRHLLLGARGTSQPLIYPLPGIVFRVLRLRRIAHCHEYASFDSLLSRADLGNLGKGWIVQLFVAPPIEDCLTGLTGSSTRAGTGCTV